MSLKVQQPEHGRSIRCDLLEQYPVSIGRPVRFSPSDIIPLHQRLRRASVGCDCVYLIDGSFSVAPEYDLLSVRRPAWIKRVDRRISQLQPVSPVYPAAPETTYGIGNVGDPLSVLGKRGGFRR